MEKLFFDSWETLFRIIISAVLVYAIIVIFLKITGKRSTSQLNNFDWIVTVMMGSIGASTIILKSVPIIEGAVSIGVLLALQYGVTKLAAKSDKFSDMILSDPKIVFYRGQFLFDAMQKERLSKQELVCAMREDGIHDFNQVTAIVFESDAKLTVLQKREDDETFDDNHHPKPSQTLESLIKNNE